MSNSYTYNKEIDVLYYLQRVIETDETLDLEGADTTLDSIQNDGGNDFSIVFDKQLSSAQESRLNTIVANYQNAFVRELTKFSSFNLSEFTNQVEASENISAGIVDARVFQNHLSINFDTELSASEENELDTLIANFSTKVRNVVFDGVKNRYTEPGQDGQVLIFNSADASGMSWTDILPDSFKNVSEESISQTNWTTYQTKLTLNTGNIEAGKYCCGWYFEWSISKKNASFDARIVVDDSDEIATLSKNIEKTDNIHPCSGTSIIDLSAGTHNIRIQYKVSFWIATGQIRRARLYLWKVQNGG